MSLTFFFLSPTGEFRRRTILMEFWLKSSGRQSFHLTQPQECHKPDIWRIIHLLQTIKRNPRNWINKHKITFSGHKQLPLPSLSLFNWNKQSVWLMCPLIVVEERLVVEIFSYPLRRGRYVINALCPEVHLRRRNIVDSLVSGTWIHLTRWDIVHLKHEINTKICINMWSSDHEELLILFN